MPEIDTKYGSPTNSRVRFNANNPSKSSIASPEAFKLLSKLQQLDVSEYDPESVNSKQIPKHCIKSSELDKIEFDCFEQRIKNREFDKTLALMDNLEYASTEALKVFYKYQTMIDQEEKEDMTKIVNEFIDSKLKANGVVKRIEQQSRKKMIMDLNLKQARKYASIQ